MKIEIIPAYVLRDTATGDRMSPFSALRAGQKVERVQTGYTLGITDHNGSYTEGCGRPPWPTAEEAKEFARTMAEKTGATLV